MNKKHDPTKQTYDHTKPNTFVVEKDGSWFLANS